MWKQAAPVSGHPPRSPATKVPPNNKFSATSTSSGLSARTAATVWILCVVAFALRSLDWCVLQTHCTPCFVLISAWMIALSTVCSGYSAAGRSLFGAFGAGMILYCVGCSGWQLLQVVSTGLRNLTQGADLYPWIESIDFESLQAKHRLCTLRIFICDEIALNRVKMATSAREFKSN